MGFAVGRHEMEIQVCPLLVVCKSRSKQGGVTAGLELGTGDSGPGLCTNYLVALSQGKLRMAVEMQPPG